jgi:hypothetical protein
MVVVVVVVVSDWLNVVVKRKLPAPARNQILPSSSI